MSSYIEVDQLKATDELVESRKRVIANPSVDCFAKQQIDTVLDGEKCLTYQYVMMTALVAKATDPRVDCLSLQVDDDSSGSYAPRTLCKEVVYPFQRKILNNVLDGSNNDPLVNKTARYPRLSPTNAARGDGRLALEAAVKATGSGEQ